MENDQETYVETPEETAARNARTMEAMQAAGVSTQEYSQVDYFGFEETHQVYLDDKVSFIQHQTLNEGSRRHYMNRVNREVRLQKSGDAFMKMATGDERHELLRQAIIGWNLHQRDPRTGQMVPVKFNEGNLNKFLTVARPTDIDKIEKSVREANPWLIGDVSIEDIDNQIAELNELRAKKVEEAEGKES